MERSKHPPPGTDCLFLADGVNRLKAISRSTCRGGPLEHDADDIAHDAWILGNEFLRARLDSVPALDLATDEYQRQALAWAISSMRHDIVDKVRKHNRRAAIAELNSDAMMLGQWSPPSQHDLLVLDETVLEISDYSRRSKSYRALAAVLVNGPRDFKNLGEIADAAGVPGKCANDWSRMLAARVRINRAKKS